MLMPDHFTFNNVDHILGDVRRQIRDPFDVSCG